MFSLVQNLDMLESLVGTRPPGSDLKVIDHLDAHALHWLASAPLMLAAVGEGARLAITLGGGAPGFVQAEHSTLRIALAAFDNGALFTEDTAFGALFLVPGIRESLRINGRVQALHDGDAVIAVHECYVHCAKALIRSQFWGAMAQPHANRTVAEHIAASSFIGLATADRYGNADLSPKGDPPGLLAQWRDGHLWFADRPGNRRTDSFRNMLSQPQVAAACLVPGSHQLLVLRAKAQLVSDAAMRGHFVVQGKTPALAICLQEPQVHLYRSAALERARLWPMTAPATGVDPAKTLVAHMAANKGKSVGARVASAIAAVPGLMQKGLDKDYRNNLY